MMPPFSIPSKASWCGSGVHSARRTVTVLEAADPQPLRVGGAAAEAVVLGRVALLHARDVAHRGLSSRGILTAGPRPLVEPLEGLARLAAHPRVLVPRRPLQLRPPSDRAAGPIRPSARAAWRRTRSFGSARAAARAGTDAAAPGRCGRGLGRPPAAARRRGCESVRGQRRHRRRWRRHRCAPAPRRRPRGSRRARGSSARAGTAGCRRLAEVAQAPGREGPDVAVVAPRARSRAARSASVSFWSGERLGRGVPHRLVGIFEGLEQRGHPAAARRSQSPEGSSRAHRPHARVRVARAGRRPASPAPRRPSGRAARPPTPPPSAPRDRASPGPRSGRPRPARGSGPSLELSQSSTPARRRGRPHGGAPPAASGFEAPGETRPLARACRRRGTRPARLRWS